MDVTNVGAATATSTTTQSAESALTTDFETFLTLLTAQMRYQDPLDPTDSTEFVSQLATFSALEQQIETNELLTDISTMLSGETDLVNLSSWIGQEIEISGKAPFTGEPITFETTPNGEASEAVLVVRDALGVEVRREPVSPTESQVTWSGTTANGGEASPGEYSATVEYSNGFGPVSIVTPTSFHEVTEVRITGSTPTLVTAGGTTVTPDDVTAVRVPAEAS